MHRSLIIGAAVGAATLTVAAAPALADTTVPVPLSFNHSVLVLPTGTDQIVTPSTEPLKVTAEVDTTTGAFTIDPSTFSSPTYKFSTPVAGTASLALAAPASGTINFATGAVTLTGNFQATVSTSSYGSCVIDTGNQTLSTSTAKPFPGKAFPAGATGAATGDGAFGVSWSTLPASTNGSGCSILNAAVDGPGGLWISRGISPVAAAPKLALTAPKTAAVAPGKSSAVKVTLANTGAAATKAVKVCLAAKAPLTSSACQTLKPAAGAKKVLTFKVAAAKAAKKGAYKLTLTATGAKSQTVTVKVS